MGIFFSDELYQEINRVLTYPHLAKLTPANKFPELVALFSEKVRFIQPNCIINDCRDAKDNFLLELAVSAKADYLVSSDPDLTVLNPYQGIHVVGATDFEKIITRW